jgi:hypothetical protein
MLRADIPHRLRGITMKIVREFGLDRVEGDEECALCDACCSREEYNERYVAWMPGKNTVTLTLRGNYKRKSYKHARSTAIKFRGTKHRKGCRDRKRGG